VALAHALRQSGKDEEAERIEQQAAWATSEARRAAAARRSEQGSIEELEKKLTPDKAKLELHYALAKLTKVAPPMTVPPAAVVDLFDRYADKFDDHLQNRLHYSAPEQIAEAVKALNPTELMDVLDLGCGTGLCGAAVKPMARSLTGVDLSPKMIEKSRERSVYDRLEVGDIVEAMKHWPASFDLIVSADVLIYMGDLMPAFEAVAKSLRPGGRFAYSVEAGAGDRYTLLANRRYAHSAMYLKRLAAMYGFIEESFATTALRTEAEKPVAGHVVVIRLA
jgi:predicted TPR repeat methyltransferase